MDLVTSLRASATVCRKKNGPTSGVLLMASTTSHMKGYAEECEIPNLDATSREEPPASIRRPISPGRFVSPSRHQPRATQTCEIAEAASTKTVLVPTSTSFDTIHYTAALLVPLPGLPPGTDLALQPRLLCCRAAVRISEPPVAG